MKYFIQKVIALIKKEFITIWKDPKSRAIIIMLPLAQLIIFTNAATMEVKNIDIAIYDSSNSLESRELISKFEHSPRFRHVYQIKNNLELQKMIDEQKVQLGLYINNDYARNIHNNNNNSVLIIADGRQTNSSMIAANYANQIISNTNTSKSNINIVTRNWFNPNLEYKWYILTIIIAMLSVVVTLILTALSVARERETETSNQLIVSPLSSEEILIGKTIPPLCIAMALSSVMTFIAIFIFKIPFSGSFALLFISLLISLLSIVGIGLFISSICNTQQQAILSVMTFMMPTVLLSGFISPIEDMPIFLQYFTYINPLRFFMVLTKGIFLKGIGIEEVVINLIPLILIATITLTLASKTFKRKIQ